MLSAEMPMNPLRSRDFSLKIGIAFGVLVHRVPLKGYRL